MCKVILVIIIIYCISKPVSPNNPKTDLMRGARFPPCKSCRVFVESFKKGMEKTAKGKFEGGDAAWEEEKLRSYAKSEVRLVEIQENICLDIVEGRDQCFSLHEQYDSVIEEWWFQHQADNPDLFQYFCVKSLKRCCPDSHYGPDCLPCSGYPDKICNGNGKCKGSGTRKGNGKCSCDAGYAGDSCDQCDMKYYESYRDNTKFLCSACHVACDGSCTNGGPTSCEKCVDGWVMDNEKVCQDINECAGDKPVCNPLQFCVNADGSFKCLECDRSCAGCTGDGPDMCVACAKGFMLINNVCVDADQELRRQHVFLTRYLTYFGLCVATCIIFQRNMILASIIGLTVGIYISVSEYMLNTPATINSTDFVETLGL